MNKISNGIMLGAAVIVGCVIGKAVLSQQRKNEKKQNLLEQCKEELRLYGDKFEGLYSATARLIQKEYSTQETEELCFRWESRLENDERTLALNKMWNQYKAHEVKAHVKKWYDLLMAIGVKMCEEKEVLVDRTAMRKYDLPDEEENFIGKKMHVEAPCWMLEEKVLEKGTLI